MITSRCKILLALALLTAAALVLAVTYDPAPPATMEAPEVDAAVSAEAADFTGELLGLAKRGSGRELVHRCHNRRDPQLRSYFHCMRRTARGGFRIGDAVCVPGQEELFLVPVIGGDARNFACYLRRSAAGEWRFVSFLPEDGALE